MSRSITPDDMWVNHATVMGPKEGKPELSVRHTCGGSDLSSKKHGLDRYGDGSPLTEAPVAQSGRCSTDRALVYEEFHGDDSGDR